MQVNLEFDQNAQAAPQSFRDAIQTAANLIDAAFTDPITLNIQIGYGEVSDGTSTYTLTNGEAAATVAVVSGVNYVYGYSQVAGLLGQDVQADAQGGVGTLPAGSTFQGYPYVAVWTGEQKALGLIDPNSTVLDGYAGFATDISQNLLVGVALHELTHAMGRLSDGGGVPDIFDFDRFLSAGQRLLSHAETAPSAYFSLTGGGSAIADYGQTSDPSDFLNNSLTTNDALNEYYSSTTDQYLTQTDLLQMEALGFHVQTDLGYGAEDLNNNGYGDLVFRDLAGDWYYASFTSATTYSWTYLGAANASYSVVGFGDINDNGYTDVVFRNNATGAWGFQSMSTGGSGTWVPMGTSDSTYTVVATGDFNGDGHADVAFRDNTTGAWGYAEMHGGNSYTWIAEGLSNASYSVVGEGDFNGDGLIDIIFRDNATGGWGFAEMNNSGGYTWVPMGISDSTYTVVGTGDFNHDGKTDIAFRDNATGAWGFAEMNGSSYTWVPMGASNATYSVVGTGDYNHDGYTDIAFRDNATGAWGYAEMNGSSYTWVPMGSVSSSYFVV